MLNKANPYLLFVMRKPFFLLSLVLLCNVNTISARKRTITEMRDAVAGVYQNSKARRVAPADRTFEVAREESQLTVLSNGSQFAVVSNDDDFDAILAYAETPFDEHAMSNPGLRWWINAMNESLAEHAANGTRPHKVDVSPAYKESVDALLSTKWDQSAPYNNMTPTYREGTQDVHFVTGCVATAMAQIMKYYNYPEVGKGTKTYRCNMYASDGDPITKRISVNFAATHYDWDNMLDSYSRSYSQASADAVATLMYHCGVSVMMDYDKKGSGSFSFRAIDALKNNFQYNEGMQFYARNYYHVDEWMDIIFSHLSQGHPVLFGAQSNTGGHEFVIDGYSSAGLVHVNWGWGGSSDGMYDMASLKGYSSGQEMVPVFLPGELVECHSSFGYYEEPRFTTSLGSLSATAPYLQNTDYRKFIGSIALIAASLEDGTQTILAQNNAEVEGYGYNMQIHHTSLNFSKVDVTGLADGKYRIYAASRMSDESAWQPVRSSEKMSNSAILVKEGSKLSVQKEGSSNWVVGVNDVKATPSSPVGVFNLSGQKLDRNFGGLPHGIYVKDGKKILK